jgi:hypothetical protein
MSGSKGMRFTFGLALVAALLAPVMLRGDSTQVKAKGGEGQGVGAEKLTEVHAKVEAIDYKTRQVTLRTEDGKDHVIVADSEVKRLDEVKVGDEVFVQYYESLTLKLDKAATGTALSEHVSEHATEKTDLPGKIAVHEVDVVAKITAIDAAKNIVTVTGPQGNSVDLEVTPEVLAKVKVGDLVNATYTEAVAVGISRVKVQ